MKRALFYGVWAIISTLFFQLLLEKHSLAELIANGGIIYFSILPFVIYYSFIHRKNVIKEFTQNVILSQQKEELQKVNNSLAEGIKERELLIKEIHHRVKNNLQIISSLLSLQEDSTQNNEVKKLLKIAQNRIISMLIIHEKLLLNSEVEKINLKEYCSELINNLDETINTQHHEVSLNVEPTTISTNQAIPCGLIINELFTNCIQHAFPNKENGLIEITGKNENNIYTLIIKDNGIGFDDNSSEETSLGLKLVNGLSKQIKGKFIIADSTVGTTFIVEFPISN